VRQAGVQLGFPGLASVRRTSYSTRWIRPIRGRRRVTASHCGEWWYWWQGAKTIPAARTAWAMASASARVGAIGFSQSTWSPRAAAASTRPRCVKGGVHTSQKSSLSLASSSSACA
jgi:hypothetical protein